MPTNDPIPPVKPGVTIPVDPADASLPTEIPQQDLTPVGDDAGYQAAQALKTLVKAGPADDAGQVVPYVKMQAGPVTIEIISIQGVQQDTPAKSAKQVLLQKKYPRVTSPVVLLRLTTTRGEPVGYLVLHTIRDGRMELIVSIKKERARYLETNPDYQKIKNGLVQKAQNIKTLLFSRSSFNQLVGYAGPHYYREELIRHEGRELPALLATLEDLSLLAPEHPVGVSRLVTILMEQGFPCYNLRIAYKVYSHYQKQGVSIVQIYEGYLKKSSGPLAAYVKLVEDLKKTEPPEGFDFLSFHLVSVLEKYGHFNFSLHKAYGLLKHFESQLIFIPDLYKKLLRTSHGPLEAFINLMEVLKKSDPECKLIKEDYLQTLLVGYGHLVWYYASYYRLYQHYSALGINPVTRYEELREQSSGDLGAFISLMDEMRDKDSHYKLLGASMLGSLLQGFNCLTRYFSTLYPLYEHWKKKGFDIGKEFDLLMDDSDPDGEPLDEKQVVKILSDKATAMGPLPNASKFLPSDFVVFILKELGKILDRSLLPNSKMVTRDEDDLDPLNNVKDDNPAFDNLEIIDLQKLHKKGFLTQEEYFIGIALIAGFEPGELAEQFKKHLNRDVDEDFLKRTTQALTSKLVEHQLVTTKAPTPQHPEPPPDLSIPKGDYKDDPYKIPKLEIFLRRLMGESDNPQIVGKVRKIFGTDQTSEERKRFVTFDQMLALGHLFKRHPYDFVIASNHRFGEFVPKDWMTKDYPIVIENSQDVERLLYFKKTDPSHQSAEWNMYAARKDPRLRHSVEDIAGKASVSSVTIRRLQKKTGTVQWETLASVVNAMPNLDRDYVLKARPELTQFFPELADPDFKGLFTTSKILNSAFGGFDLGKFVFNYRMKHGADELMDKLGVSRGILAIFETTTPHVVDPEILRKMAQVYSETLGWGDLAHSDARRIVYLHFNPEVLKIFPIKSEGNEKLSRGNYQTLLNKKESARHKGNVRANLAKIILSEVEKRGLNVEGITEENFAVLSRLVEQITQGEISAKTAMTLLYPSYHASWENIQKLAKFLPAINLRDWYEYIHHAPLDYFFGKKADGSINLDLPNGETWGKIDNPPRFQKMVMDRVEELFGDMATAVTQTGLTVLKNLYRLMRSPGVTDKTVADLSSGLKLDKRLLYLYFRRNELPLTKATDEEITDPEELMPSDDESISADAAITTDDASSPVGGGSKPAEAAMVNGVNVLSGTPALGPADKAEFSGIH